MYSTNGIEDPLPETRRNRQCAMARAHDERLGHRKATESRECGRCRSWCARTIAKPMGMRIRRIAPENGTQSVEPGPKPACRLCAALARNPKAGKGRSFRCHCCVATRGSSSSSSARGKIHASLLSRDFGRCFPPPGPGHPGRPPHARSHVLSVARLQHEQLLQRPCWAAAWAHRCWLLHWHVWQAGWRGSFRHPSSRWPLWQAPVALSTLAQSFPEAPRALPGGVLPVQRHWPRENNNCTHVRHREKLGSKIGFRY